ncbi:MAG: cytochrome b N-terminal domain-containing protein [Chthonomonadales bacterium]
MQGCNSAPTKCPTIGTPFLPALLVALTGLTGVILLPYYHPAANRAYHDVAAISRNPFLQIARSLHHWLSAVLILLAAFTTVAVILRGTYRRPHHLAWITFLGGSGLFLLFQITGHALPWDSHGVCTVSIETGIAGNVPVIGAFLAKTLRGQTVVGPATLRLWYIAHVVLLPGALILARNRHVRALAAYVLGVRGEEDALTPLQHIATDDPDPTVRLYAVEALGRIGGSSVRDLLHRIETSDGNGNVRFAATQSLRRMQLGLPRDTLMKEIRLFQSDQMALARIGKRAPAPPLMEPVPVTSFAGLERL